MNNDKKQVWYVSGPMSGLPDQNKPAFHAETARMRALGFEVINPAENDLGPSATWSDYMRLDLAQLMRCTAILVLPGYEDSRGSCLELTLATALGMKIEYVAKEVDHGGIYIILGPNNHSYIGQTWSFKRRWAEHRSALRGSRHHCKALQRAWNKHGAQAFQFRPISIIPKGSFRNTAEQQHFDLLGRQVLYNSALNVVAPAFGITPSAETRAKMSAARLGVKRGPMSEVAKRKLSAAKIGKYRGDKSPFYGIPKTVDHRGKLSKALIGKFVGALNPVACAVICVETGEEFETFTAAALWLRSNGWPKADLSTIRKAAHGFLNRVYGFQWKLVKVGV